MKQTKKKEVQSALFLRQPEFHTGKAGEAGIAIAGLLFLMGLFSVLDVILEKPMAEALKVVHVAGEISNALIYRIGVLAPVYDFMLHYETANWAEVSRLMLLKNIDMNTVYEAYTSALKWYRTVR